MKPSLEATAKRFLAIDLHKHYLVIGGVNRRQEVILNPRRISLQKWLAWAKANLLPTDAVVLEATTNAWDIYDQLAPLVDRIIVAHPPKVKWIAEARVHLPWRAVPWRLIGTTSIYRLSFLV